MLKHIHLQVGNEKVDLNIHLSYGFNVTKFLCYLQLAIQRMLNTDAFHTKINGACIGGIRGKGCQGPAPPTLGPISFISCSFLKYLTKQRPPSGWAIQSLLEILVPPQQDLFNMMSS